LATDIGVATGRMRSESAAALVGAGIVSALLFALLALALRKRAGAAQPGQGRGQRRRCAVTNYAGAVRLSERFLSRRPSQISRIPNTMA
jgi:hypothetical protein